MNALVWPEISAGIAGASGAPFAIESRTAVGGGCINQCYRVAGHGRAFFVKLNSAGRRAMFEAEAAGLAAIAATATVRVPAAVVLGIESRHGVARARAHRVWRRACGEHGAARRRACRAASRDGPKIRLDARQHHGATPQINTQSRDWIEFWRDRRLGYQLALAANNGAPPALLRKGERLAHGCGALFGGLTLKPALLHGDLWGGNAGFDRAGAPVIFDPAVYYGHREADLAMTEFFGGFSANFYAAYRDAYPLDAGYDVRKQLYNLYHVLNHFNLFGGGYARQAEILIDRLLAEI